MHLSYQGLLISTEEGQEGGMYEYPRCVWHCIFLVLYSLIQFCFHFPNFIFLVNKEGKQLLKKIVEDNMVSTLIHVSCQNPKQK